MFDVHPKYLKNTATAWKKLKKKKIYKRGNGIVTFSLLQFHFPLHMILVFKPQKKNDKTKQKISPIPHFKFQTQFLILNRK